MQSVFGINIVALVDGEPRLLNLKEVLDSLFVTVGKLYLDEQNICSRKAREKGHILEGLAVALANIDEVIELIKKSPTSAEAKEGLLNKS